MNKMHQHFIQFESLCIPTPSSDGS